MRILVWADADKPDPVSLARILCGMHCAVAMRSAHPAVLNYAPSKKSERSESIGGLPLSAPSFDIRIPSLLRQGLGYPLIWSQEGSQSWGPSQSPGGFPSSSE